MSIWLSMCVGAVAMWIILGGLAMWREVTYKRAVDSTLEVIISLPWVFFAFVWLIITTPFICIWKFFRNAIRGVSVECWEKAKLQNYWKIGNLYVVYDKKARAITNKLFLVRVVKPANYIVHCPEIQYSDEPSVPDGEFR